MTRINVIAVLLVAMVCISSTKAQQSNGVDQEPSTVLEALDKLSEIKSDEILFAESLETPTAAAIDSALMQPRSSRDLIQSLLNDQVNFYSPDLLLLGGVGLAAGAVFANTQLDGDFQRHLQSSLHHANSDDWLEGLHANKELGDGRYTLPIYAGAWLVGKLQPDTKFGGFSSQWGERTLRGFAVGAPPVLILQRLTGASRPEETIHGSEWEPLKDNNGVSGHAFMGSLPFITAAKMTKSKALKVTLYGASCLAPLSRTADGAHYPSQVALGWGMAFMAATAVQSSDEPERRLHIISTLTPNGSGMAVEYRF